MPLKRFILEMGAGNDLHGGDYTKAALRAVQDALHHSSLAFIRSLGLSAKEMQVEVTIGVQEPAKVDAAAQGFRYPMAGRFLGDATILVGYQLRQGWSGRRRGRTDLPQHKDHLVAEFLMF